MREKPSHIVLLLLSVALLAPAASARPPKPAHAAASRKPAHAAEPVRVSAHAHGKQPARAEEAEDRRAAKSSRRVSDRHVSERDLPTPRSNERSHDRRHPAEELVVSRSAGSRRGVSHPAEARRIEEPKASDRRRPAPVEEARVESRAASRVAPRVEPRVEDPAPEAAAVELPPIEVHHNRKVHLQPEPAASAQNAAPRKATVQDFLDTPAAPADGDTPPAAPASQSSAAAPAAKHPVSVVVRKVPALPVVKPVAEVVPDPVIEPVLYSSGGRLIVPPAMKGSHEILVHQNEMADIDGLTRIQDDADLDRLRGTKELVALPAGAELEVDERLPLNRRYCRPWTAQFLAAMARAHYARFHTPLQVNSAVRTVEFQERLRYTNGNAAPAEGETASPHLTGQAVDLAKHGLSMTEIAWMRGYLMPLVQQGKVDVEEEFQQACFHISVYKKYSPQAAPKRDIPTRRSPATALAAAIR